MKIDFEKISSKVEDTANKIDIIMKNRLIIAVFLIIDGISFILSPNNSINQMGRAVAIFVFLASGLVFITNITAKTKDKKSIIISIIIMIICIITYIYPNVISMYLHIVLAIVIIINGLTNLLNSLNLNKMSAYIANIEIKIKNRVNNNKMNKDFKAGIKEQTEKIVNPLSKFINRTTELNVLYIIFNSISIILGILLLVKSNITIIIWGIVFIYTGITDFITVAKSRNLAEKLKEKDFKSIMYDDNVTK